MDVTHVAALDLPFAEETAAANDLQLITVPSQGVNVVLLNLTSPALSDVRVRQAIARAVDRDSIAEALWSGRCTVDEQPIPAGQPGHNDDVTDPPAFDQAAATALLAEAGVPDLTLRAITLSVPPYPALTEVLQAQLAEVGITLEVEAPMTSAEGYGLWAEGQHDVMITSQPGSPYSPATWSNLATGRFSVGGPHTPEVTAALEGLDDPARSDDERAAQLTELVGAMVDEANGVYICQTQSATLARDDVLNPESSTFTPFGLFDVNRMGVAAGLSRSGQVRCITRRCHAHSAVAVRSA